MHTVTEGSPPRARDMQGVGQGEPGAPRQVREKGTPGRGTHVCTEHGAFGEPCPALCAGLWGWQGCAPCSPGLERPPWSLPGVSLARPQKSLIILCSLPVHFLLSWVRSKGGEEGI